MDEERRAFFERLIETPGVSGYEAGVQRAWVEYVSAFADDVTTDAYGNAVAVHEGGGATLALVGHADQIGFVVRHVDDEGFLGVERVGGTDRTVTRGQHVRVMTGDGPVAGVVGQTAIHLRDRDEEDVPEVAEQHVDIGATDRETALDLVSVGDPITFEASVRDLAGGRLAAPGTDNRIGLWAAAEGLRRAAEVGVDATVAAVSTVQEEVGGGGAEMVGFDLAPDAAVAVDVTHATDTPDVPSKRNQGVELGAGPTVVRGGPNHPALVESVRAAAESAGVPLQLEATRTHTGTDADSLFTQRGGVPTVNVGLPNRYMHTPVEVVDAGDLDALAELLGALSARADADAPYRTEV